jgi:hypothetical protein
MKAFVGLIAVSAFLCFVPRPARAEFADVPAGFWAYAQIEGCVAAGIVQGYTESSYCPDLAVTRDQMAAYIARAVAGGESSVPGFAGTPSFPDVTEGFWALKYVEYAVDEGVVTGYDDGRYHPEYEVNRAQMAIYVARAMLAPSGEAGLADYLPSDPRNFPDVPSDYLAYPHIEYCAEHGVVGGYDDGLYHPEIVVTRDQMAVYVAKAFDLVNPFAGTYSATYPTGSMTVAIGVDGGASVIIIDASEEVLEGAGTVSDTGALTATAQNDGASMSVALSGQFINDGGAITGSGSMTGSMTAAWTAEKIADVGVNAFAGNWSGTYGGFESGTWQAVFDVNGSVTATAQSPSVGEVSLTGTISPVGFAYLEGSGSGTGGPFTITWEGIFYMQAADAVGTGVWDSTSGYFGEWSGQRQ